MVNYRPLGILETGVDFQIKGSWLPLRERHSGRSSGLSMMVIFRTLRLPLIAGRAFETSDADESRGVTIVSKTFPRRFFGAGTRLANVFDRAFQG